MVETVSIIAEIRERVLKTKQLGLKAQSNFQKCSDTMKDKRERALSYLEKVKIQKHE